jgi:hypothetical protein
VSILGENSAPIGYRPPERLHRVHTCMNLDDDDDPKIRKNSSKWKCGTRRRRLILGSGARASQGRRERQRGLPASGRGARVRLAQDARERIGQGIIYALIHCQMQTYS